MTRLHSLPCGSVQAGHGAACPIAGVSLPVTATGGPGAAYAAASYVASVWLTAALLAFPLAGCKKAPPPPSPAVQSSSGSPASSGPATASGTSGSSGASSSGDSTTSGSLADRLKAVQSSGAANQPKGPAIVLPDWTPAPAAMSSIKIPLVKGLIQTGVIADANGDHESIRTIQDATAQTLTYVLTNDLQVQDATRPQAQTPAEVAKLPTKRASGTRIIDVADLATAHRLTVMFAIGKTEHIPGSIPLGASTEVLNQLHAGQPSQLDFQADPTITLSQQFKGHTALIEDQFSWNGHFMYKCTIKRVGDADLAMPMLVNGERVRLPVIHAMCPEAGGDEAHFYFLDQPDNALLLATLISSLDARTQMVKIDFPVNSGGAAGGGSAGGGGGGSSKMEQALADKKPVEVYGIYFDFNSSSIKPESQVVLQQISDILHKNPTWKLSIAGHTDNIGDGGFNQGLSERRAAAVKEALVSQYKIAPDRLSPSGHGASQPIESNATMEGRARNRRVELQRQ